MNDLWSGAEPEPPTGARMTVPYRTPVAGELLANRYELGEHIDSGGMAEVWEAKDHTLGRTVAVKILHAHLARDAAFLRRFRREAINAARLQHPTIVAIYDAVSFDGLEAIVMERIEGRTLRSVLDQHPKLPARDVVDMGRQIAQALHVAHQAGVVHRDIKPSNIMLCEDRRIRVTDFGIAKAGEDTDLTRTGTLLGTAKYLAPEQVLGEEVDARSDLYGLGVVLFEALAGRPPFDEGNDYATAQARIISNAPRLSQFRPDLPATLDRLIERLLEQEPDDRPASAEELAVSLSSIRIDSEELNHSPGGPVDMTTIDLRGATMATTSETDLAGAVAGLSTPAAAPLMAPDGTSYMYPAGNDEDHEFAEEDEPAGRRMPSIGTMVVIVLMAGSLATAALLFDRFGDGNGTGDAGQNESEEPGLDLGDEGTISLSPVQDFGPPVIAIGLAVDPLGDQTENDERAGFAIDGDSGTAWSTEKYSKPGFSDVKTGVGYRIDFAEPSVLTRLVISSPTSGWSARIFVGDTAPEGPEGWQSGPFELTEIQGDGEVTFDGVTGSHLLIWLTFEGTTPTELDDGTIEIQNRFELTEVTIE